MNYETRITVSRQGEVKYARVDTAFNWLKGLFTKLSGLKGPYVLSSKEEREELYEEVKRLVEDAGLVGCGGVEFLDFLEELEAYDRVSRGALGDDAAVELTVEFVKSECNWE